MSIVIIGNGAGSGEWTELVVQITPRWILKIYGCYDYIPDLVPTFEPSKKEPKDWYYETSKYLEYFDLLSPQHCSFLASESIEKLNLRYYLEL